MLRTAALLAVLVAFPATTFASPRPADPAPAGATVARLVSCDVTSPDRAATFYARVDAIAGASKLQIRFQLLERLGHDSWNRLDVPALRQWHTSQAGVQRFVWKQTVDALRVGAAYKSRVQFRWLSAAGVVLDSASRDTPVCRGPLPNLTVGNLTVKPGPTADTRSYRVSVSNTGKIDADDVDVSLSVDRAILDTITISHLAAGDARTVAFTGPVCHYGVRVTADPDHSIGESFENDNSQLFACP
jgi:hypothetical protein